jgi:hypothetical protein
MVRRQNVLDDLASPAAELAGPGTRRQIQMIVCGTAHPLTARLFPREPYNIFFETIQLQRQNTNHATGVK